MPKMKSGTSAKDKASTKANILSSIGDASIEDVDSLIRDLQNRQQKLKQAEKNAKRAATKRAEQHAEKEYERTAAAKQRSETTSGRARRSAPTRAPAARNVDDDEGSVEFNADEDDDEFVVESRRASSTQVASDDEMRSSAGAGRARKRKTPPESEDYDEMTSEVTGNSSSAEPNEAFDDIEATEPPVQKKARAAATAVTVTVTPAQPLKKKRVTRKKKAVQEPAVTEPASSNNGSDDEQGVGNYTPYKRVINPSDENKPRIDDFSPTTKKLAKRIRYDYAMQLSTANPFMDEEEGKGLVGEIFASAVEAAQEGSKLARRGDRFVDSTEYRMDIENVGKNVDSGFRGRVVSTAQPLVDQKYGFEDKGQTTAARQTRAEALAKDGSFAFADWEKRDGYLLTPLIPKLLAKHFLAKRGRKGKALVPPGPVMNVFKDVSDSLIAFLLTVIHCAVDGWKSGVFKKVEFALTEYEDKYKIHLASIQTAAAGNPEGIIRLRKSIWESACTIAGIAPSISVAEDDRGAGYLSQADINAATAGW